MPHVVFVAPHFLENTNRYVKAFADLEGLTFSVISRDPERAMPPELRRRVAGHHQVRHVADAEQLADAVENKREEAPVPPKPSRASLPSPARASSPTCPA